MSNDGLLPQAKLLINLKKKKDYKQEKTYYNNYFFFLYSVRSIFLYEQLSSICKGKARG